MLYIEKETKLMALTSNLQNTQIQSQQSTIPTQPTIAERTKVKVYGVGGTGLTIVSPYVKGIEQVPAFSELDTVLVDTSYSNLLASVPKEKFFHVDGADDGSGKDKSVNVRAVKTAVPRILSSEGFEPENFNVIVGSTSGGSGSVLMHVLAEELIRQGKNVMIIAIVAYENGKNASNAYKTLIGLHRLAESTGQPIPVKIIKNELDRSAADQEARNFLAEFSLLVSNQHLELDTKDIEHFLNFTKNKITSAQPSLVGLECHVNTLRPDEIRHAITVAELHSDHKHPIGLIRAEYGCNGFLRDRVEDVDGSYYFITTTNGINELIEFLQQEEQLAIRNSKSQTSLNFDKVAIDTNDDLIL